MKSLSIACLLVLALAALVANVEGSAGSMLVNRRTAFLALNLVDIRCPSKMNQFLYEQANMLSQQGLSSYTAMLGGRRLLGFPQETIDRIQEREMLEIMFPEIFEEEEPGFLRRLMKSHGNQGHGKFTLKEWRVESRRNAVYLTDQVCGGAPDDKGPGSIFPLHLDITVNPAPAPTPSPYQPVARSRPEPETKRYEASPAKSESTTELSGFAETPVTQQQYEVEPTLPPELTPEVGVDPVILEDSGPNATLVMGLLLLIGVGIGVGLTLYLVRSKDNGHKADKNEARNLKAKLRKLREVVEG
mmetsp:Transcript_26651/g.32368  ORF Transcript_26651/g.32368 Transcript_26651/m.32368 type:complete len:302 (-) Transcript_26651:299-1204(-)|eukprot:CAMPEP_0197855168 /NCGR_PEP_ID=MMETSP1438-20131217/26110_1 /TAXON_ID=1461541 /ORGANISM="Pterosperma sp., Strain CCMP1384" /LENGTH=301 /DNA_ID=CAMNT_0043470173 /DNA_START=314 /DNA_END=1219 /DNA_ORIENTATION=+